MEEMEKISVEKETESMGNTRSETSFLSLQNLMKVILMVLRLFSILI
jgi:hypothetical protein